LRCAELERLRAFLDKQLAEPAGRVGAARQPLQRRLMAQQNRGWDFDLEEGMLDSARCPRGHRPDAAAVFKMEQDTNSATRWSRC
jgi:cobaltochelatase CobT